MSPNPTFTEIILLALFGTLYPVYASWRECVAVNPAFPPSFVDFFMRGQTTCLPGHERLTKAMPKDVKRLLEAATEDVEAEEIVETVVETVAKPMEFLETVGFL